MQINSAIFGKNYIMFNTRDNLCLSSYLQPILASSFPKLEARLWQWLLKEEIFLSQISNWQYKLSWSGIIIMLHYIILYYIIMVFNVNFVSEMTVFRIYDSSLLVLLFHYISACHRLTFHSFIASKPVQHYHRRCVFLFLARGLIWLCQVLNDVKCLKNTWKHVRWKYSKFNAFW